MLSPAFYSFIGLAVGDAIGTTNEELGNFRAAKNQTDMVGGGVFGLKKGQWTDDTSQALAMAVAIIEAKDVNLGSILDNFWKWAEPYIIQNSNKPSSFSSTGTCFDVGGQSQNALIQYIDSQRLKTVATFSNSAGGNGSVMRLAPVPVLLHRHPQLAIEFSAYSSLCTHNHGGAVDSCRYLAALIVGAIQGATKAQLCASTPFVPRGVQTDYWTQNPLCTEVLQVISSFQLLQSAPINSGGAVDSLKAVLWHLQHSRSFEDGVLAISNQGGDADTIAAIFGQVAGPLYKSIRQDWIEALALSSFLQAISVTLCQMADALEVVNSVPYQIVDHTEYQSQNSSRDWVQTPATLRFNLSLPMTAILQGYHRLVDNVHYAFSETITSQPVAARVVRDIQNSMLSWRTDRLPALEVPAYTLELDEFQSLSAMLETLFLVFLNSLNKQYFRFSFEDVRLCWKITQKANPYVLSGQVYDQVPKLITMVRVDNIQTHAVPHCLDYLLYTIERCLSPFLELRWTYKVQFHHNPDLFINESLFQTLRNDFFTLFQQQPSENLNVKSILINSLTHFKDTQEQVKHVTSVLSAPELLNKWIQNKNNILFVPKDMNLFYTMHTFVPDPHPCPSNLSPNLSMFFNYSTVLPVLGFPRKGFPAFNKLYAETVQEKVWLFLHWQLQQLHLHKMKQKGCACFEQESKMEGYSASRLTEPIGMVIEPAPRSLKLAEPLGVVIEPAPRSFVTPNVRRKISQRLAEPIGMVIEPALKSQHLAEPLSEQKSWKEWETQKVSQVLSKYELTPSQITGELFHARSTLDHIGKQTENMGERQQKSQDMIKNLTFKLTATTTLRAPNNLVPTQTIIQQKKEQFPNDYLPELLQLPPPQDASASNARIRVGTSHLNPRLKDKITQLISKYFYNVQEEHYVTTNNNLDLLFLIGSKEHLSTRNYSQIHTFLKNSGYLILVVTDVDQSPIANQLKDTAFTVSDNSQAQQLNQYFEYFFAGHFFYMKRLPGGVPLVSSSFVTLTPSQPMDGFLRKRNLLQKTVWKVFLDSTGALQHAEATKDQKVQILNTRTGSWLPANYVSTESKAKALRDLLVSDWNPVLTVRGSSKFYKQLESLGQYFYSYMVRGGGKCPFLSINALLALKGMPLMNWQAVLHAANNYIIEAASITGFQWEVFTIEQVVPRQPSVLRVSETPVQAQENMIIDFDANAPNNFWLFIVSYLYHVRIVMFSMYGELRPLNNPQVYVCHFFKEEYARTLPTLFILLHGAHYYPLFQVQDIPQNAEHEFNIV